MIRDRNAYNQGRIARNRCAQEENKGMSGYWKREGPVLVEAFWAVGREV